MSYAVNHYPALVIGADLRVDGLHTSEVSDGVRIREKSGLTVAYLRDLEATVVAWPDGQRATLLRAGTVEYGTAWIGAFGDAPVRVLIAGGSDCGCSGPKRTDPTETDRALLETSLDDELPV